VDSPPELWHKTINRVMWPRLPRQSPADSFLAKTPNVVTVCRRLCEWESPVDFRKTLPALLQKEQARCTVPVKGGVAIHVVITPWLSRHSAVTPLIKKTQPSFSSLRVARSNPHRHVLHDRGSPRHSTPRDDDGFEYNFLYRLCESR